MSVYSEVVKSAKEYAESDFLHIPYASAKSYADSAITISYADLHAQVEDKIATLRAAGYDKGMRVGLLLDNRPEFFTHWFALNALGISIVPLNGELAHADMAYIVSDSALVSVFCFSDKNEYVEKVISLADSDPVIYIVDGNTEPGQVQGKSSALNDECALLYTSGSTGKPKGCSLSNAYFLNCGQTYADTGGYCALENGQERLLTPLPLVHMNALACSTMVMIMTGGCIVQLDRFHPKTWWDQVKSSGATIVHYLGVLPAILLQLPETEVERSHKVRFGFGAGVNPKHHKPFEDRFGIKLLEAWSMTEVGAAAWVIASEEPRHIGKCCFGKAEDFMEYKIADDDGNAVPIGQPGEFLVRREGEDPRYGFFSGYHGRPDLTEEAWLDGWFHTGDIVREDTEGSLYFVDRKKSIIRRSGENISTLEVEAVLSELPGVGQVGVTPVPDDLRGDEVMACIIPEAPDNDKVAAERVFAAAQPLLAYYKLPGYVAFMDALPLTPSQKLQRGELKTLAKTLVEEGKVHDLRDLKRRPKG